MGLFDFLTGDPAKKQERAIEKAVKTLTNPFGPTENRHKALETLIEINTDESLVGALRRFTSKAHNGIVDQDEKDAAFGMIVDLGERAIQPVQLFIQRYDSVTMPLRILEEVSSPVECAEIIVGELERIGTEYIRVPEKKVELLAHLGALEARQREQEQRDRNFPKVLPVGTEFLEDIDEDVQLAAVELVFAYEREAIEEPVLRLFLDEDTSVRMRLALAERMTAQKWQFDLKDKSTDTARRVADALPEPYALDRKGFVKK